MFDNFFFQIREVRAIFFFFTQICGLMYHIAASIFSFMDKVIKLLPK